MTPTELIVEDIIETMAYLNHLKAQMGADTQWVFVPNDAQEEDAFLKMMKLFGQIDSGEVTIEQLIEGEIAE